MSKLIKDMTMDEFFAEFQKRLHQAQVQFPAPAPVSSYNKNWIASDEQITKEMAREFKERREDDYSRNDEKVVFIDEISREEEIERAIANPFGN